MELLVSSYGAKNRKYLREALANHEKKGERAYLIVPEQFTMESDLALLKALDKKAIFDIRVHSFTSLAREVKNGVGGELRTPLLEGGRGMLLRSLILEHEERLKLFKEGFGDSGLIKKLLALFDEFGYAKLSLEEFKKIIDKGKLGTLFQLKLEDIALLYEAYLGVVEKNYIDNPQKLNYLLSHIKEANWLKGVNFYVDGFMSFNNLEYEVLLALENLGAKVVVALILPKTLLKKGDFSEKSLYAPSLRVYQKLGELLGTKLRVREIDSPFLTVLKGDEKHLFTFHKVAPKEAPKNLILSSAISTSDEVHDALSFIRKKVCEGARYRDFSLVVTSSEPYFTLFRTLSSHYGIPLFIDERKKAKDNALLRYFILALSLLMYEMKPLDLLSYLKLGFHDLEKEALFHFENYIKRRKLRGKSYFEGRYFNFDKAYYAKKPLREAQYYEKEAHYACLVHHFLKERLLTLYELTRKEATIEAFAKAFYEFSNEEAFLQDKIRWENEREDRLLIEENKAVLKGLYGLLDEMVEALGDKVVSFKVFGLILLEGLETLTLGLLPPSQDQVICGALGHTRSSGKKWQLILGLSDQYYPSQNGETSLFSKEEEAYFTSSGLSFSGNSERILEDERLALYDSLSRCSEGLYLSYALKTQKGESMNEAYFIKRLKLLYPKLEVKSSLLAINDYLPYSPPRAIRESLKTLRDFEENLVDEAKAKEAYTYYTLFMHYEENKRALLKRGRENNQTRSSLSPALTKALYPSFARGRMKMSISELEKFKACPFSHFVRYGLRPRELEISELEKRELGSFIHDGIEIFGAYLKENHHRLAEIDDKELLSLVEGSLREKAKHRFLKEKRDQPKNAYFLKRSEKNLLKLLGGILTQMQSSVFLQVGQEVHFGEYHSAFPPLYIEVLDECIALEGYIDRVDKAFVDGDEMLAVIDYKTGRKNLELSKVLDGLDLQLLLYLKAVTSQGAKPAGAFYLRLSDELFEEDERDRNKVLEAFKKSLLLDGLVLRDEKVLRALDADYDSASPQVLRFRGRKKGALKKDNVISEMALNYLLDNAKNIAKDNLKEILEGKIIPHPYLYLEENACTYCNYKAICAFEPEDKASYRQVLKKTWQDLEEALGGEADV